MTLERFYQATLGVMKKILLILAVLPPTLLVALLTDGSKSPAATPPVSTTTEPLIADIAASYKSYQKVTAQPVYVNPELAMLCRGANQQEVAAALKTKGPHANTGILIYMNDAAAGAFASGSNSYRPGAVIVKQKSDLGFRDPETGKSVRSADAASLLPGTAKRPVRADPGVGGMVKRAPGFDPTHGDWEYFYFEDASKIETGRIASCVRCHDAAKSTDYVFGTWATRKKL